MKKITLLACLLLTSLFSSAQAKYYITSNGGEPWGQPENGQSMTAAFGAANWTAAYFETVNVNALFQPTVCFIYMDGGDANASEMNTFLSANMTQMMSWVAAGGKLFLNSAPNEGGNINFGFNGVTLVYPDAVSSVSVAPGMVAQTYFTGPAAPSGTAFTGNDYAHSTISGGITVPVMVDATDITNVVLAERFYGLGRVMFGGMTTTNFHSPNPNATNFRSNLFSYLGGCCGTTESVTAVASAYTICPGQSTTLTPTGVTGGTYTAWPGNITGTTIVLSPTVTTVYNVVGTPTSGCSSGETIKIFVDPSPSITVAGATSVCAGNAITFTASGANSYTWSNGATTSTIVVTPTANTTYTIMGDAAACSATAAVAVSVSPSPVLAVAGNTLLCNGGPAVITASGATTYSWSNGPTTSSITVTPSVTTNYTLTGTTGPCTDVEVISVIVSSNPTVNISGGTPTICAGTALNLTAGGASTYSWSSGQTTSVVALTPSVNTTYTVVGTNTAGCTDQDVFSVSVTPSPTISVTGGGTICAGNSATLTISGAADSYSWSSGQTSTLIVVSPTVTTSYTAMGTSSVTNCSGLAVANVSVSSCIGIAEQTAGLSGLSVYPNPTSGILEVVIESNSAKTISISDYTGRIISTVKSSAGKTQVDMRNLANGIYQVRVETSEGVEVIKVIKE